MAQFYKHVCVECINWTSLKLNYTTRAVINIFKRCYNEYQQSWHITHDREGNCFPVWLFTKWCCLVWILGVSFIFIPASLYGIEHLLWLCHDPCLCHISVSFGFSLCRSPSDLTPRRPLAVMLLTLKSPSVSYGLKMQLF